ncbi:hypothetical protein Q4520_07055 [Alteromonas sp. 1_MG-2023]|uniref:hypothetical protein n=1 Tax=unclassified Alteromonas TaxID=2614992 RepID=UPI0026E12898|nr:hypothetical protein [Alteromonas sp. 1_MG-2023]MDO6475170.1 hypothetical protein [Alteromonas sp. 1_MG-2023]
MDFLVIKFLHVMGLVYWLGGDLGTFIASRYVLKTELGHESRVVAAKILNAADQGPRLAMPLMFASGLHLSTTLGLTPFLSGWLAVIWATGLAWLASVAALHWYSGAAKALIIKCDWVIRVTVCAGAILTGFFSVFTAGPVVVYWAAWKLALFGVVVLLGILIRFKLKPFGPAFAKLASGQGDANTNTVIQNTIGGAAWHVKGIWILLLVISAFGLHLI